MLDQVFRRALVRERILANPIGPILQRYTSFLVARGHQSHVLHQYIFTAEHFGQWLNGRLIDHTSVGQFIGRHLPQCQCIKPAPCGVDTVRAALNRLLEMLGSPSPTVTTGALADRLLMRYEEHLSGVCGLAHATIHCRLRYARAFLTQLELRQIRQLQALSPHQIAEYVSIAGRQCKPSSGQVIASSTRSFLRFLLLNHLITRDLAAAVPSFANWRLASLPKTVSRAELEKLVVSVDDSTALGQRDRAVLLCMTELGLRAADVAAVRPDGVDLRAGILRLRSPKQRSEVELPMTQRLTAAIGKYLDQGRPACKTPSLFVIHRAPFGAALESLAVRNIVRRRATDAGLGDRIRGTHVIRHSVATHLINAGASIKQIADLLGHQSIDTTAVYAKVDLHSLASVALPWPIRLEVAP